MIQQIRLTEKEKAIDLAATLLNAETQAHIDPDCGIPISAARSYLRVAVALDDEAAQAKQKASRLEKELESLKYQSCQTLANLRSQLELLRGELNNSERLVKNQDAILARGAQNFATQGKELASAERRHSDATARAFHFRDRCEHLERDLKRDRDVREGLISDNSELRRHLDNECSTRMRIEAELTAAIQERDKLARTIEEWEFVPTAPFFHALNDLAADYEDCQLDTDEPDDPFGHFADAAFLDTHPAHLPLSSLLVRLRRAKANGFLTSDLRRIAFAAAIAYSNARQNDQQKATGDSLTDADEPDCDQQSEAPEIVEAAS